MTKDEQASAFTENLAPQITAHVVGPNAMFRGPPAEVARRLREIAAELRDMADGADRKAEDLEAMHVEG